MGSVFVRYTVRVHPDLDERIKKCMEAEVYNYKAVFVREAIRRYVREIEERSKE